MTTHLTVTTSKTSHMPFLGNNDTVFNRGDEEAVYGVLNSSLSLFDQDKLYDYYYIGSFARAYDFYLKYFMLPYLKIKPYLNVFQCGLVCSGIIASILIIRAFLRMGLKDVVTIVLLNIAISDLIHLLATLIEYIVSTTVGGESLSPRIYIVDIEYFPEAIRLSMILANALLTTFLAVQRCLCVMRPLQFKGMFTRRRTLAVVWIFWGYCLLACVLKFSQIVATFHDVYVFDNETYIAVGFFFSMYQQQVEMYVELVNSSFLLYACQAIVVVCIFFMLNALRKSAKFRRAASQLASTAGQTVKHNASDMETDSSDKNKTGENQSRERKVLLQVILVSVIFVMTHLHYAIYSMIDPFLGLRTGNSVINMSGNLIYTAAKPYIYILNSSVNIFVYLKYNSSFRQRCFQLRKIRY